ncbi:AraC family transcriptional regulator [Ferrimonas lipolytica]|uniref:AraC family transcriptional regulator n=1 Tax=Ferrimonas lipolytica TaxID=2724191 RepID=A0A6H1UFB3_9GAMM|nr:AraC family transcriptional regulator [Ferrimonas lipolytica]QIZ77290.1 AraC family transcriptional regulator [Ferrimonas lipolytica]
MEQVNNSANNPLYGSNGTTVSSLRRLTISAPLLNHSLTAVRQADIDLHRVLAKCQLNAEQLTDPKQRIDVDKVVMLQRYLAGAMQCELYGLLHRKVPLGTFEFFAVAAVHCRTIGDVLTRLVQFYNLFDNSFRYHIDCKGRQASLRLERLQPIADNYAVDSLLTVFHRFCSWLCNDRILLNQVTLDFAPPEYADEYRYIYYGAPVLFSRPQISLWFDRSYLDHLVVQNESRLASYLRRAPLEIYLPLDAAGDVTIAVRQQLKEQFSRDGSLLGLDAVASALEFHPQTLRRRLKGEQTSFDVVKAQIRRDIAIHFLSDPDMRIDVVAERCGYSEPSAFIRAFKHWTGYTPLQFRKGLVGV